MRDQPGLEKSLAELSDPYHARYGHWLTLEEANYFSATSPAIAAEVLAWAESTGAACESLPESLKCAGSVAAIEALLSTELGEFAHVKTGGRILRAVTAATVPDKLIGKVVMVTGLTAFPIPRLGNSRPIDVMEAISAVDYSIVPQTFNAVHNVTTVDGSPASTVGPIEFQNYPAFVQSDLDTFTKNVAVSDYVIPPSNIIGAFSPNAQAESTLDEQYVGAIGTGNTQWYQTVADWQYEFAQGLSTQAVINVMSVRTPHFAAAASQLQHLAHVRFLLSLSCHSLVGVGAD